MRNSSEKDKIHILGLTSIELELFMSDNNEKKYRGRQLYQWLYKLKENDTNKMTDIPLDLRERIIDIAVVNTFSLIKKLVSKDNNTIKYLFELYDGSRIESVLMLMESRNTICVSTQVGCALGCAFCATGESGFKRNLSAGEIIEQFLFILRDSGKPVTNIVFMGMGEPLLNYDAVIKSADILSDQKGCDLAKKRITISTAGIIPGIKRFIEEGQKYKLAVSLNATSEEQRNMMMPVNKKYSLKNLMDTVKEYTQKANKTVTFEYILFPGINDSEEDIKRLAGMTGRMSSKINIIPYNPASGKFPSPSLEQTDAMWLALKKKNLIVNVRESKGQDVAAACGQLAGKEK